MDSRKERGQAMKLYAMKSYSEKLIELTEKHAEAIARQWYSNVKMNPRTPAYHTMPENTAIRQAIDFYTNFRHLFYSENPFEEANVIFYKYAEARYNEHIPLSQVVYALVLMRRHLWLFAENQATFVTPIEMHQAAESLSRTILMFDYAIFIVISTYDELLRKEMDEKFKQLNMKNPFETWNHLPERPSGEQRKTM
jgi:hypothetical protein